MFKDESPHTAAAKGCQDAEINEYLLQSTHRAVCRLIKAHQYAADTGRSPWEFAVTIGELLRDGVSENELRWLACRGYIDHAHEVPTTGSERAFDRHVSLRLSKRSAFVITNLGNAFNQELLGGFLQPDTLYDAEPVPTDTNDPSTELHASGDGPHGIRREQCPTWDRDRRELRLNGKVVKVFKLPSPMQEAILVAFEEEHWPPRIDDPLPVHPELLPKRRLHDTIKSLNRNQKNALIHFMGDGTGEGIRWELSTTGFDSEPKSRHVH